MAPALSRADAPSRDEASPASRDLRCRHDGDREDAEERLLDLRRGHVDAADDGDGEHAARLAVPPAPPPLANPGFEADAAGVASPSGWASTGAASAAYTEWGGHSGGWRLSHWSPEAFSVDTAQTVSGLRPGWYTLQGWARRSAGPNDAYLELRCGCEARRVHVPVAWPHQWLRVVVSVPAREGSCTVALHTAAAGGEWTNFDDLELLPGAARLPVRGADVSSLKKSEDLGGVYRDARGRRGNALAILAANGASHVRLRVWVDPADGYHDRAELVEMSRRAHRAGLRTFVDLHFSDTWADPGHQAKPAAWAGLSVPALRDAVYAHTYDVCTALSRHGHAPDLIQLGNELNSGMLWPDGHTWNPPNWENLAAFLQAGSDAVKACSPSTKVVLHLANGGDAGAFRWWLDEITRRGVRFDVVAASYYGYWHGSLGDLQANLDDVAARYGKEVLVAETAYPFTLEGADGWPNIIGTPGQLVPGYPATPAGQASSFRDVLSVVRAVPGGRGLGAFYWDATWIAVPGNGWDPADPATGNAWENQAMFDLDGRALPVVRELAP
jgi:arabinogalactan endo-1,4-beta-galactosidase